jgi:hypothetical protein
MINSVRNTVLSVLNKNNYGYISPSDFNLFAQQAQMEVFEEYFSNYNKATNYENIRQSGTDYADLVKPLAEALDYFIVDNNLHPKPNTLGIDTNQFYNPSATTTGTEAYMINKVICYTNKKTTGLNDVVTPSQLVDTTTNFNNLGISVGDIVVNNTTNQSTTVFSIVSVDALALVDDIFLNASEEYTIYSYSNYSEAERVSNGKISSLNMSILTSPSTMFPAYTQSDGIMTLYPSSIVGYGSVKATYFRYPKNPKWTYITLTNGEPAFDQSQPDYQDFEVPLEDEYKLAMKILQYCGMSIREIQATQFAIAQEQHEQPTFSQQQ